MKPKDFLILRVHDGYILKRVNGTHEQHSHMRSAMGCQKLLTLIVKGISPEEEYFRTAARRVLSEEEFESLTVKTKQPYYNSNRAMHFGGGRCT